MPIPAFIPRRAALALGVAVFGAMLFVAETVYSALSLTIQGLTPLPGASTSRLVNALPEPDLKLAVRNLLGVTVKPKHPLDAPSGDDYTLFESGQVRPLALSADGSRLYAVNTPDGKLEIFDVTDAGLVLRHSVPVGMEPVAVAVRGNEAWVVNHLSDSVSVVDIASAVPQVKRTLLVGDEPRDIVFAGPDRSRAFITAAHRGQNSPYTNPANPGEFETPGVGRADLWVFDAAAPSAKPLTVMSFFTDTPRALAVSPDGSRVYVAGFHTGNQTTALSEEIVCDGGHRAAPCRPFIGEKVSPGGVPAPNETTHGQKQKEVGLIVKYDGARWRDELGRDWSEQVRFSLPDRDVFAIDANAAIPRQTQSWAGVGTVLFNLAVNPVSGKVYASNTEAVNEVRFEGARPAGSTVTTVQGKLAQSRISVLDGAAVLPRHLNKHIDYRVIPSPAGTAEKSLATPTGMVVSADGKTLYLAAFGSAKVGVFDTAALESDSFTPNAANHIELSGGGPSGLVLDEARGKAYVLTRFNNAVTVIDTAQRRELASVAMFNPEPARIVEGRRFLYDARFSSSNGEASCASCHIFGDLDSISWDLGNPFEEEVKNRNPFRIGVVTLNEKLNTFTHHPMKGPMATQSLRGMARHGPLHWRGDRTGSKEAMNVEPDQGGFDENAAFLKFNPAFVGLLGREAELSATEMQAFADFALKLTYPPNPVRRLDKTLTPRQQRGADFYFNDIADLTLNQCNGCHVVDKKRGLFGSDGRQTLEGEAEEFKIPHLRNMYSKVGMFGRVQTTRDIPPVMNNDFMGEQIRGFGYRHDGSIDTLTNFIKGRVFLFPQGDSMRADVMQYVFAVESDMDPAVGQQVSVGAGSGAEVLARVQLLLARSQAGDCELVAKGVRAGKPRGWLARGAVFVPDRAAETSASLAQLLAGRAANETLTFTCVPPGAGVRVGVDRDRDGVRDGDEAG